MPRVSEDTSRTAAIQRVPPQRTAFGVEHAFEQTRPGHARRGIAHLAGSRFLSNPPSVPASWLNTVIHFDFVFHVHLAVRPGNNCFLQNEAETDMPHPGAADRWVDDMHGDKEFHRALL